MRQNNKKIQPLRCYNAFVIVKQRKGEMKMALMNCPECNREISDTVEQCPHCGYQLKKGYAEEDSKTTGRKFEVFRRNRKKIIIVIIALLFICAGSIIYCYYNAPVRKITGYLSVGKVTEAQRIYDQKIKTDSDAAYQLEDSLDDLFKKMEMNYGEGKLTYDEYCEVKKFISKYYQNYEVDKLDSSMNQLKNSKASFERARQEEKNKKYSNAIFLYNKIVKSDKVNYREAQKHLKDCQDKYKTEIDKKIEKLMKDSQPSYDSIEKEFTKNNFLNDDKKMTAKYRKLKIKVRDYQISQAKNYQKQNKYQEAIAALEKIHKDNIYDSEVKECKTSVEKAAVNWATTEAAKYANNKKYGKAIDVLKSYQKYDTTNMVADKLKLYEGRAKKAVIKEFKRLKSKMTIKYDSVDREYTVVAKGRETGYINLSNSINLEARAQVSKRDKDTTFQLIAGFQQEDWIFTEQVAFAVGNYRETYIIDYNDRYTQIMNGGICEWMYLNDLEYGDLFDPIDKLVSKITTSKKTTIRFGAKGNGTRTHILSTSEKSNVRNMYKFCVLLNRYKYFIKYL